MARKYGKKASEKIERTLHEWKRGTLKSGSGGKVTSQKQAIAIGLSQARARGYKVPPRSHAAMSLDARVRAYLGNMRPGQEIDARGIARAIGGVDPLEADYALERAQKAGLATTSDGRWFGSTGTKTIAHATKWQPKYGNDPGDWQRGFDYGSEEARHDGSPRETLALLAENARTDFDRGQLAAYQAIFGRGPKARHARKKKSPAELERELAIAELTRTRNQLLNALGYAGNTRDQVTKYHERIAEVDAKIRALK